MQSFLAIETLQCADEPGSPFLIALGVPAPTVVGHVVEDQGLGFSVFKAGPPTSRTAQPSGEKVILKTWRPASYLAAFRLAGYGTTRN